MQLSSKQLQRSLDALFEKNFNYVWNIDHTSWISKSLIQFCVDKCLISLIWSKNTSQKNSWIWCRLQNKALDAKHSYELRQKLVKCSKVGKRTLQLDTLTWGKVGKNDCKEWKVCKWFVSEGTFECDQHLMLYAWMIEGEGVPYTGLSNNKWCRPNL